MSGIVVAGDTSGSITIQAPAVAGSGTVLTLPTTSGTLFVAPGSAITVAQGGTGSTSLTANSVMLGNGTSALSSNMVAPGASGNYLVSNGTTWVSQTGGSIPNIQTFNSSATWTKPSNVTMARIQAWGGGGGGARGGGGLAAGGGGGYNEITVPVSQLTATVTINVGAAGLGATTGANGGAGGNSTLIVDGSTWGAYGGGGGGTSGLGGGGGGTLSAGGTGTGVAGNPKIYINGGNYLSSTLPQLDYQGRGYMGSVSCATMYGTMGIFHGGGGGSSSASDQAPSSIYGGGGGASTGSTAGTSIFGGAGGAGAAGTAPGGGGGCANTINNNGFNGGAGRVIITCW